jgi:hypothetical protein
LNAVPTNERGVALIWKPDTGLCGAWLRVALPERPPTNAWAKVGLRRKIGSSTEIVAERPPPKVAV